MELLILYKANSRAIPYQRVKSSKPQILIFFFLQVLRLFATLWVMTDSMCLYLYALAWPLALKFVSFCVFSPWYLLYLQLLGYSLLNLVKQVFTCLIIFSSPLYLSFLRPFSSSYPRCFQKL